MGVSSPEASYPKIRPAGLEPATCGLEVRCSIQLSYGRKLRFFSNKTAFNRVLRVAEFVAIDTRYDTR
jgi:hypothetical protein